MTDPIEAIITQLRTIQDQLQSVKIDKTNRGDLTDTELEALAYFASGATTKEVAEKFFRSTRTIDTMRTRICWKLRSRNITQAVDMAWRKGILK